MAVGAGVGAAIGRLEGFMDGKRVDGRGEGTLVGKGEGIGVVGRGDGKLVGRGEGIGVVGRGDGMPVGNEVGSDDGKKERVGSGVGSGVGTGVQSSTELCRSGSVPSSTISKPSGHEVHSVLVPKPSKYVLTPQTAQSARYDRHDERHEPTFVSASVGDEQLRTVMYMPAWPQPALHVTSPPSDSDSS